MSIIKTLGLFTCAILAFGESKFVDTLSKCSIKDGACQGALVQTSLSAIGTSGIAELGIPPVDPFEFKDINILIMDLIELKVIDGNAKGIANCVVEGFTTEIEKGHSEMVLVCNNLSFEAKYTVSGTNPLLKDLFNGETIRGDGTGHVNIEKIKFVFQYFYDIAKNKDGDAYFDCTFDKTIYEYELMGKVTFDAENIHIGGTDATQVVVDFLNNNYKFVVGSFSKDIFEQAMEYVYRYVHKFFDTVPAKYFIIEDLSGYVKN